MGAMVWAVDLPVDLPVDLLVNLLVNLPADLPVQRQYKNIKLSFVNVLGRTGTQSLKLASLWILVKYSLAKSSLAIASSQISDQASGKISQRFGCFYRCLHQRHDPDRNIGTGRIESFEVPTIGYGGRKP